ncbi:MAG: hypothetical protein ACK55I_01570, partial [bacterium]
APAARVRGVGLLQPPVQPVLPPGRLRLGRGVRRRVSSERPRDPPAHRPERDPRGGDASRHRQRDLGRRLQRAAHARSVAGPRPGQRFQGGRSGAAAGRSRRGGLAKTDVPPTHAKNIGTIPYPGPQGPARWCMMLG